MAFTRGFTGRRRAEPPGRLPPGQHDVGRQWPVLSAEPTPGIDLSTWTLAVDGAVDRPTSWAWDELQALGPETFTTDLHCVTSWSRFGTSFTGVGVDGLLDTAGVAPEATFVMAHSTTGYTTNLPLADLTGGKAWVVWEADGAPLTDIHGGPVRLLVPHLYLWKSAKWLSRLELMTADRAGFWERNGYHDRGDPWREQRYQGDA